MILTMRSKDLKVCVKKSNDLVPDFVGEFRILTKYPKILIHLENRS